MQPEYGTHVDNIALVVRQEVICQHLDGASLLKVLLDVPPRLPRDAGAGEGPAVDDLVIPA